MPTFRVCVTGHQVRDRIAFRCCASWVSMVQLEATKSGIRFVTKQDAMEAERIAPRPVWKTSRCAPVQMYSLWHMFACLDMFLHLCVCLV